MTGGQPTPEPCHAQGLACRRIMPSPCRIASSTAMPASPTSTKSGASPAQTPVGITAVKQLSGDDKITLTLQQSGSNVAASYQTSLGGRGRGTGILTGNIISAMKLQSETENCPGSFTASLTFSNDTVSWTYNGQDCGGPVQGNGVAKKTKP
jgi:hypothetical protein